ncbi:MAG: ABC transporter substrate-binding protein, partial [Gemmatimonadaceae bacterium]
SLGIPAIVVKTEDTTDIFRAIATLGRVTARDSAATAVATSIRRDLDAVRRAAEGHTVPRVLYVVYDDPPMTAGPRTFIGELISLAGGRSIFADSSQLWPNVTMEAIVQRDPDLLIVPVGDSSPNPLERFRQLAGWRALRAVREGHVATVPADVVSRPSPIIGEAARVLLGAMHPELARTP